MSIRTHDGDSIEDYLIPQLNRRIFDLCGDLVNVINGCLQLVPFSVKEFLIRPKSQWFRHRRRSRNIMAFRVHLYHAYSWLAAACIEYLERCDYGSPLHDWDHSTNLGRDHHFLRYSSTYMITHLHQSGLPSGYILNKIDRFLNSDQWIPWLELYSMNIIEDASLRSQEDELQKFATWLGERPEKVLRRASDRLKVVLEERAKEYGQDDSRTEQLRLFLGLSEHASTSTSAEAVDSCAVQSTDQTTNVLPIIQIIRQNAPLTLQLQVDLLLKMQMHLQKAKRLTNPLQILFHIILQKASAMPVYVLLLVGDVYRKVGRFEQTHKLYLVSLRRVTEKEVRVRFLVLHSNGRTYHSLGQNERALEQFKCAPEERERLFGHENEGTLSTLYWIGIVYHRLGQYEDVLEHFSKALAEQKKVLGPEHKHTLNILYWNGIAYTHLNQYEDALKCFTEVLTGQKKVLGPENEDTLNTLYWVGIVYSHLNRNKDALECLTNTLAGQKKVFGPENEHTLDTLFWAGRVYASLKKYEDALESFTKVPVGQKKVLGPDHEDTLHTLNWIKLSRTQLTHRTSA